MMEVQKHRLHNPRLNKIVEHNITRLQALRDELDSSKDFKNRLADSITGWSGSMTFVALHVVWFAAWVAVNAGWTPLRAFDPYPFQLLTMIVSLEAIFLATFVLISQNREAEIQSERNELDLQIDLLAEYEVTRVLALVHAIAQHLGLKAGEDEELDELMRNVAPEAVVRELQQRKLESKQRHRGDVAPAGTVAGSNHGRGTPAGA
jgi:uncharacterized membrane protein